MRALLGTNLHFWGDDEQSRLLSECIWPAARQARRGGLADAFQYLSFDRRGPHFYAVFVTDTERAVDLESELGHAFRGYLERRPSRVCLRRDELMERDLACRGRELCSLHRQPGLAENNSFAFFQQTGMGYPFSLARGAGSPERLWKSLDRLAFWTLGRSGSGLASVDAMRFVCALDRALEREALESEEIWRHHACTLLPKVAQRVKEGEAAEIPSNIPEWLGQTNMQALGAIWKDEPGPGSSFESIGALVADVARQHGRSSATRRGLVREIIHLTLNQLRQPVSSEIPIVLYAWYRSNRRGQMPAVARPIESTGLTA